MTDDKDDDNRKVESDIGSKLCIPDMSCVPIFIKDWLYTLVIGFFVVSYWRGTWVLLDIWTCSQPHDASLARGDSFCLLIPSIEDPDIAEVRLRSARITYGIGLALLFVGVTLMWSGSWLPRLVAAPSGDALPGQVTGALGVTRWIIVYILGASAVCLWHGIWYWADAWILPNDPLASYWTTSVVGSTACFLIMAGNSLLAPPSIFLLDGPGENPPPIAVTLLSSYYAITLEVDEKPPKLSFFAAVLDMLMSFIFLPFGVVWFWRGSWLVLDWYLWGMTPERQDVLNSMGWGTILFVVLFIITSESVVGSIEAGFIDRKVSNPFLLGAFSRLRTYLLAWGTVSFWRVVWYIWDEFIGMTSQWSAWTSHAVGVVCLTLLGCVASINAPASTLGVDAVPNPKCADEPLFAMIPVPYELLYCVGISRQEWDRTATAAKPPPPTAHGSMSESGGGGGGEIEMAAIKEEEEEDGGEKGGKKEEEMPIINEEGPAAHEGEAIEESKSESTTPARVSPWAVIRSNVVKEEGVEPGEKPKEGSQIRPGGLSSVTTVISAVAAFRSSSAPARSYHEVQRPGIGSQTSTGYESGYAQRPSRENPRNRSKSFRSR